MAERAYDQSGLIALQQKIEKRKKQIRGDDEQQQENDMMEYDFDAYESNWKHNIKNRLIRTSVF